MWLVIFWIIVSESCSVVSDSLRSHVLYSSWNFPGQNNRVGSLSLLQRIFPTQGLNIGLQHWSQILYQLGHREPRVIIRQKIKLKNFFFLVKGIFELGASWYLSWKRIFLQCRRPTFDSWVGKLRWRRDSLSTPVFLGFPCGSAGKESVCNAGGLGSISGLGRSPGERKGYPLQYSGLENSIDCLVHEVANSWTWLCDFHLTWVKVILLLLILMIVLSPLSLKEFLLILVLFFVDRALNLQHAFYSQKAG